MLSAVYAVVVCLCVCVCVSVCHTPVLYHMWLCYGRGLRKALVSRNPATTKHLTVALFA